MSEFCRLIQNDYTEMRNSRYRRDGLEPPEREWAYPPEEVRPFDLESAAGWRVAVYTLDGYIERIFNFRRRLARVRGGLFGVTLELRDYGDDRRRWRFQHEMTADCDHPCWPIPNPSCGCGFYACPSPAEAGLVVRRAIENGRGFDARKVPVVYPVEMRDVYTTQDIGAGPARGILRQIDSEPWRELIAARARVAGPVLTTSDEAAADLTERGFEAQSVADDAEGLAAYLTDLQPDHETQETTYA